jgi:hypothetical protein
MKLASRETDKQFNRLFKLHGILTDPIQKELLQVRMVALTNKQPLAYTAAETLMYGSAEQPLDLTLAPMSTPTSTPVSKPASTPVSTRRDIFDTSGDSFGDTSHSFEDDIDMREVNQIMEDVLHQSGFVRIPKVCLG